MHASLHQSRCHFHYNPQLFCVGGLYRFHREWTKLLQSKVRWLVVLQKIANLLRRDLAFRVFGSCRVITLCCNANLKSGYPKIVGDYSCTSRTCFLLFYLSYVLSSIYVTYIWFKKKYLFPKKRPQNTNNNIIPHQGHWTHKVVLISRSVMISSIEV